MPDKKQTTVDEKIIQVLSNGAVVTGAELGAQLGMSRVAVKKRIDNLLSKGLPVQSFPGKGYQVLEGHGLLSSTSIRGLLGSQSSGISIKLVLKQELKSTMQLVDEIQCRAQQLLTVVTESQPAGVGRRGRSWVAEPYKNIALSFGFVYPKWPANPAGLSLAFGTAVHRALASFSPELESSVLLKWPNDIYGKNASGEWVKLAGMLVNASGEANGELNLNLGLGINVSLASPWREVIDQPVVDLQEMLNVTVDRNQLIALIIENIIEVLVLYPKSGVEPFVKYWNQYGLYVGRKVKLTQGSDQFNGKLMGLDERGELCLKESSGKITRFNSANLSLRLTD